MSSESTISLAKLSRLLDDICPRCPRALVLKENPKTRPGATSRRAPALARTLAPGPSQSQARASSLKPGHAGKSHLVGFLFFFSSSGLGQRGRLSSSRRDSFTRETVLSGDAAATSVGTYRRPPYVPRRRVLSARMGGVLGSRVPCVCPCFAGCLST